ncbi:hypothetical protein CPB85DRAFT_1324478 [Mucidula mucida]|nr:hypothetical protein CPB85DRAFT_1324472 [Mucidula mucida]KAF8900963.1 hypothetical protein CPB85DRAFT_1324478 [Mucidula mucida]
MVSNALPPTITSCAALSFLLVAMPAIYSVLPLSPAAAYAGTLFDSADSAALFAARIAFEQAPTAFTTPAIPSCRIEYIEDHILPLLASRDSLYQFKPTPAGSTPGALRISRRDGKLFNIRRNALPVIDFRTLNSSISSAHVAGAVHHGPAQTLATLNATFSLVPEEYVLNVLSLCSHCFPVGQTPFKDVSNLAPTSESSLPKAECSSVPPSSLEHLTAQTLCLPHAQRKRPTPDSPTESPRPKKSSRHRTYDTTLDDEPLIIFEPEHPSSPSPLPVDSESSLDFVEAVDDDEMPDSFFDDEADSHEDFLLMMHAAYERAGLPADRLLGTREEIESAAAGEDYYYDW